MTIKLGSSPDLVFFAPKMDVMNNVVLASNSPYVFSISTVSIYADYNLTIPIGTSERSITATYNTLGELIIRNISIIYTLPEGTIGITIPDLTPAGDAVGEFYRLINCTKHFAFSSGYAYVSAVIKETDANQILIYFDK
jgi:hypothetical protein